MCRTPTDAATHSLCQASSTLTSRLKTRALLHARQIASAIIGLQGATYAGAGQVTKGTHTSQVVAKILMSARLQTPAVWEPA
ncbi:hypothetical protein ACFX1Z_004681 [Malus domestica]